MNEGGEKIKMKNRYLILAVIPFLVITAQTAMAQTNGYNLTVNIGSHAFGNPTVNVEAQTANGNYDQTYSVNIQNPQVTFSIPPNSGPSVKVCVSNSGIVGALTGNCQTFSASGSDMTVNMSP